MQTGRIGKVPGMERGAIILEDGQEVAASLPVIVSASRRTDIPAFYSDWFFDRLEKGYSAWINPFNGRKSYISYRNTKFIVFWSKDPRPLLRHLDSLAARGIGCYIQFTLNDYENDGLERNAPPLAQRIGTFRALADRLGKGSVIWRFDPLLLTENISIGTLLERLRNIGSQIHEYAEKLVFSFADILSYARVRANLERSRIPYRDWTLAQMREFAAMLVELNRREGWNLELATCGERADLEGIVHNRCVDDKLILRLSKSPEVWRFLGAEPCPGSDLFDMLPAGAIECGQGRLALIRKDNRDPGQRKECGCVRSKDIGQYGTCPHLCAYCYANAGSESVRRNHALHKASPSGDLIAGPTPPHLA